MFKCISFKLSDGATKWILVNSEGKIVPEVKEFIKSLDIRGRTTNTLKTYCYSLKLFFEYIYDRKLLLSELTYFDLVKFVEWLLKPKIRYLKNGNNESKRTAQTVNLHVNVATSFLSFCFAKNMIRTDLSSEILINRNRIVSPYKSFLAHIKNNSKSRNSLFIKSRKKSISILTSEQLQDLKRAISKNVRDRFLIELLYSTGMRIGEALSLFVEDFQFDKKQNLPIINLVDRGNLSNGAFLKSGGRKIPVSHSLMDYYDDYIWEYHDIFKQEDEGFLFIKIQGKNKGSGLEYSDVSSIFKRIRKKVDFEISPHLFRHTHGTLVYQATKDIEFVRERLGHRNIQTTQNFYMHPSKDELFEEYRKAISIYDYLRGT